MLSSKLSTSCGFTIHTHRIENSRVRVRALVFRRELSPISGFLISQFRCSTAASDGNVTGSPPQKTSHGNSLVDYLVDSLGFSEEEAISAFSKHKVSARLRSKTNTDLVVNLLRDYGLTNAQINDVVSSHPQILTYMANHTLEPRLRVLRDLGLSGSDLVEFIKEKSSFFRFHLNIIDYLRQILGSDEQAVRAIKNSDWLFISADAVKSMQANVLVLQNHGIPIDKIKHMIARNPTFFVSRTFEERMIWVVEELGIPCDSPMFVRCLRLAISTSKLTLEEKLQVFRSFGWSQTEIYTLLRTQPVCVMRSTALIRKTLKFFMTELNYTSLYLCKNPVLLMLSLEKRVKPRYEILKILSEKKLINSKPSLCTVAKFNEQKFLEFLLRFETELPSLCQTYIDSIKNTSNQP